MTLQEQITQAKTLWASALDVPCPPDATFRLWLQEHEYRMLEGAIAYAPRQVERLRRKGKYSPTQVYKYVSTFLYQTKIQSQKPKEKTLIDIVNGLSATELSAKSIIRILNLFVMAEIIGYQKHSSSSISAIRLYEASASCKRRVT